jgi:hypothetical protein
MDAREWEEMRRAVRRYDKPGSFAAYMGYEWTVDAPFGGHHNVLFRDIDGVHPVARQRHPTLPDLYRGLHQRYRPDNVLIIPHAHMTADWTMNDRALEPLVEIVSSHGTFEWIGRNYLSSGFQLGFVGASDDHIGHPGYRPRAWGRPYSDNFGGLAAVMSPTKDRNRLFEAMRDRRTYATNGERIILRTTLNGMRMGVVTPSAAERIVQGQVVGTGPIESITLIKNGRDHETLAFDRPGGEPGEDIIEVRFFSQSEPAAPKTPSRASRTWTGRIVVEGAQVLSVSAPQAEAFNHLTEFARPSAAALNAIDFALRTRGDEKAVRIRVAGGLENVRVRVLLPEARVPVEGSAMVPAPGAAPATIAARDVDPGGELRGAGTFDDKIWVRRIRPTLVRDRTFRFVDRGAVRDGDNYYVRVVQSDGGMAWSSPGWVGAVRRAPLTARLRKVVDRLRSGAA